MSMNGALALVRALEAQGVVTVFGYPGGAIMPVYDALLESSIRHVLTRHEQGAALAAIGFARTASKPGVCLATSGPGATNLVTGLADAMMDSVPLIAITGQVPGGALGTDAFQEVDTFGITMPVVKHSYLVRCADDIPAVVAEAFEIAGSGRPGPVLIDLPKDVAAAAMQRANPHGDLASPPHRRTQAGAGFNENELDHAVALLEQSRRPVVYVGGGVVNADAVDAFRQFVETSRIPTVQTLKGLGSLPCEHELSLGMLGMHGLPAANMAVQESDLLVVVGARFDDRVTGKLDEFAPHARVIHLDVDPAEMGKIRQPDAPVLGDLNQTLERLAVPMPIDDWRGHCLAMKRDKAWDYDPPVAHVYAPTLLRDLSLAADENVLVTCDVGQHQMWVAQHYQFKHPRQHLTSGGLGTMGFGLPAAIGAQLADPDATVICVTGDGSIMMNIQELATLRRYDLPVRILLLDNQSLGMVRQWQHLFFADRYSEIDLSDNPDFTRVAEAFGMSAFRVDSPDDLPNAIDRLLHGRGSMLAHVAINTEANVWPLVPPATSNSKMLQGSHI